MKLPLYFSNSCRCVFRVAEGGFTLAEILTAITVFVLLVGGIVAAHLFGLRMFQISGAKINATGAARQTVGIFADEIRTCKDTKVGSVTTNGMFTALLDGEKQQGNALLISPTTNTTNFIIYFVNPSDQTFRRTTSKPGTTTVLAESVTNSGVFCAQDLSGNVLTNNRNNRVIHLNLEFYQPQRFMQVADYYKLETSVTRRAE